MAGPSDAEVQAVLGQVRQIAANLMRGERREHTLQTTALVNEAYLRLRRDRAADWSPDLAFYRAAAEAMRRVLTDHARGRNAVKRGGTGRDGEGNHHARLSLDVAELAASDDPGRVLDVEDALADLEATDGRSADVVRLRVYAGLTVDEIAGLQERSPRSVARDWTFAKAWLYERLGGAAGHED